MVWENIEVPVFVSFWQFLYGGMYESPMLTTEKLPEDGCDHLVDDWSAPPKPTKPSNL